MRLQDKGVQCMNSCPFCETNYENDYHVFIGCEEGKKCMDLRQECLVQNVAIVTVNLADLFFSLLILQDNRL